MTARLRSLIPALWIAAKVGVALYLTALLLLWLQQKHFIYYPDTESFEQLEKNALTQGLAAWKDAKGQPIGWVSKPPLGIAAYRCLVFTGNAGYATRRTYIVQGVQAISEKNEWEIYLMEYPGYGARPGDLSEKSFVEAGVAAVDALKDADSRPIFIVGESLGTGVAAQVASQRPDLIAGILLITPFDEMANVIWDRFPIVPHPSFLNFLLRDKYRSDVALKNYDGPVAFLIAGKDQLIPSETAEALYDSYHGPKKKWVQADAGHNDLNFSPFADWWQEAFSFLVSKAVITKF